MFLSWIIVFKRLMMKRIFITALAFGTLISCHMLKQPVLKEMEHVNASNNDVYNEMQMRGVDFFAVGQEPLWTLEIDFDKSVSLTIPELNEEAFIPILQMGQSEETPEVNYTVKGDGVELKIRIQKNDSQVRMAQETKPYRVYVDVKTKKDKEFVTYSGMGEYYGDLLLHDSWKLKSINDEMISEYSLRKEPFIDIQLDQQKVSGFLGCNNFTAGIYFGRNKIFFQAILSTKMACVNDHVEKEFFNIVSGKMFNYRLEGLQLILENKTDTLIFNKMDGTNGDTGI
jgi:heat shock protein HslJ/uncharacterized membrane protein